MLWGVGGGVVLVGKGGLGEGWSGVVWARRSAVILT